MQNTKKFHSGFITIVGLPNVGKSTLMNSLIGEKIAIVSNRPQTTRNRIMGVYTQDNNQIVFLDTPGVHSPRTKLGEFMEHSIKDAMHGMDELIVMFDVTKIRDKDYELVENMKKNNCPKFIVLNKIDLIEKNNLLLLIDRFSKYEFNAIIPISAKNNSGLDELKIQLLQNLPEGPQYFPEDMVTDQPEQIICSELVREKALLYLQDEIPHGIGVEIMDFKKIRDNLTEINATIYCEKSSHKGIIIGKQGSMLKKIGTAARLDIETLMMTHINLKLWVKVKDDWRNSNIDLRTLGYSDKK